VRGRFVVRSNSHADTYADAYSHTGADTAAIEWHDERCY
jgi:hypothetical protein